MIDGFFAPTYLFIWVLTITIVIIFFCVKKTRDNFVDIELIKEVYGWQSIWYRGLFLCIIFITLIFFIFLAGPYNAYTKEKIKKNGIDIQIVFDLSYSMIATDIRPSRIEVAKKVFLDFIWELKTDRVGLVLFSGKPFHSVPLSYDYEFLSEFMANMSVDTIDQIWGNLQWTAIGDALVLASDTLMKQQNEREKVIILITDGEANSGVEPELALKLLKDQKIRTYTIWVGKWDETTIEVLNPLGILQRVNISGVDEEILKKIALETWGVYFKADSRGSFSRILETIWELEKKPLETEVFLSRQQRFREFYMLFLLLSSFAGYILFFKNIKLS